MQWKNQKPLLSLSAGLKKATRKHVSPGLVMCASSWFYSRICLLLSLTGRKKMTVQGLMSLSSFDKKAKGWELFIKAIYKRGGKPGQSWLCSKFQVPLLLLVPHADGSIHKGTSCKLYVRFCFGHVNIAHFTSHLTFIFFLYDMFLMCWRPFVCLGPLERPPSMLCQLSSMGAYFIVCRFGTWGLIRKSSPVAAVFICVT